MTTAKQILDQLSQDLAAQRLARERADALAFYKMDLLASKAEGKAELLLVQLRLRFGPPSAPLRRRIEAASSLHLDAWAGRMLKAESLDEVFAP